METMFISWFGISSFILGVLLFFPVRKLVLGLNVNRLQFKLKREINDQELDNLKKKVAVIAAVISMTFAFFYNKLIVVKYFSG